jgi:hypothetical protein
MFLNVFLFFFYLVILLKTISLVTLLLVNYFSNIIICFVEKLSNILYSHLFIMITIQNLLTKIRVFKALTSNKKKLIKIKNLKFISLLNFKIFK